VQAISGGGLNFTVKGGVSAPDSPKENTIWVNTGTAVTGWIFSAGQPSSAAEGAVWFEMTAEGSVEFNALTENAIVLEPLRAMQRIGGQWQSVPAMSYHGGSWVQWIPRLYLYNAGDVCAGVSGGWVAVGKKANASASASATTPSVTYNSDNVYVKGSANNASYVFYNKSPVDLTNYDTLIIDGEIFLHQNANQYDMSKVCVWSSIGTYYSDNLAAQYVLRTGATESHIEIDVSALTGSYHVGFAIHTGSGGRDSFIRMADCYLEKTR